MTQAYNLAILANAVDTSGRLNVGTNATGTLPLTNGGTGTTNTVNTVVAGTGISVSTAGTQVTVSATGSGTVTSVATGNGLTGGTITTSGTISITAPSYQSVGSYLGLQNDANTSMTPNTNYSGNVCIIRGFTGSGVTNLGAATGTWRMSSATASDWFYLGLRVA